ncbi:hypothetical protein TRAPUB_4469 [Trametes pubescens]|uniref:Uncharacterized protein n=1 Tax=Trametes pubescens TaxID=154538 RepID=A0A1M2VAU7_TRAPU|nr:hypothetical protein TRAPUB_4469 [Trametes pubescens]
MATSTTTSFETISAPVPTATLQVPAEHSGPGSSSNMLRASTPSDVSSANSPAVLPATAAQPPDSAIESFTLATPDTPVADGTSASARVVPESLLPSVDDDDDDDEFIPRGGSTNPSSQPQKPRPPPTGVKH